MSGSHPRHVAATLGVAGAGLVLGHWLAYSIVSPHATVRDEMLAASGHGYLPYAIQVATLAGVTAIVALFVAQLARRQATPRSFHSDLAGLAALQSVAFVAMEAGERLLTGASLHDLTHTPLLAIGLTVQIGLAVAGALTLRLTQRAAGAIEPLGRSDVPPIRSLVTTLALRRLATPIRPIVLSTESRAPPLLPCIDD
jgi:hypothetical protein